MNCMRYIRVFQSHWRFTIKLNLTRLESYNDVQNGLTLWSVWFVLYVRTLHTYAYGRTPSPEIMHHFSILWFGWCLGVDQYKTYILTWTCLMTTQREKGKVMQIRKMERNFKKPSMQPPTPELVDNSTWAALLCWAWYRRLESSESLLPILKLDHWKVKKT